ncbi:hypothetical protein [Spirillospora sp. NPDC048824]|uniref:hypothetical protein n=1 Tax=Spirillospora sp. NPDC048824 TaxID=3364526 RepID=UPI003720989C
MNRFLGPVAVGVAASVIAAGLTVSAAPVLATSTHDGKSPTHAHPASWRGQFVSSVHLRGFSAGQLREWLAGDGFNTGTVRYGVDAYRVVYRTVDVRNRPTTASGLVVLPRNGERRLATVSYGHGTNINKAEAPSMLGNVWTGAPAATFAAGGFAAVAPDYLGMGVGPGAPPWKHVPSETTASLDLLRAARRFVPRHGRTLERDVMVTGFSQGASAALGLARVLQDDRWFRLRAIAPISGAYDFRGAELPALVSEEEPPQINPKAAVVYSSYLLTSWNRIHGLYDDPSEIFEAPYDTRVEGFFDGTTPAQDVVGGLPGTLDELLTEDGLAMLRHPRGRFAEALRQDEVCTGWVPHVPIRLYKISRDEEAVTANTDHCHAAFAASGRDVPVVDVGEVTYEGSRHLGSNLAGTALVARWFAGLR